MEAKHLTAYVGRLIAAARALEQAVKADDPLLIQEAHEAVGRARSRLAPPLGLVVQAERRRMEARAAAQVEAATQADLGDAHEPTAAQRRKLAAATKGA